MMACMQPVGSPPLPERVSEDGVARVSNDEEGETFLRLTELADVNINGSLEGDQNRENVRLVASSSAAPAAVASKEVSIAVSESGRVDGFGTDEKPESEEEDDERDEASRRLHFLILV
jgi:hypothetical protein